MFSVSTRLNSKCRSWVRLFLLHECDVFQRHFVQLVYFLAESKLYFLKTRSIEMYFLRNLWTELNFHQRFLPTIEKLYRKVCILSDKYLLSLPAVIPLCVSGIDWVDYVNTLSLPEGSNRRYLSDKIMTLYCPV
jgi:hypothetical protein